MISVLLILATSAYTVPPGLAGVGGLKGCWRVSGKTLGEDTSGIARGHWHLGERYFNLQFRTTGSDPYEASITYGAGKQPRAIGSVFLDTTGGLYEPSLGLGELEQDGFVQRYQFSDVIYVNRFTRSDYGWRWTITEQKRTKPLPCLQIINCAPLPVAASTSITKSIVKVQRDDATPNTNPLPAIREPAGRP